MTQWHIARLFPRGPVAPIRANRQNPPLRHRDHGGKRKSSGEKGLGFILCGLCVSVVNNQTRFACVAS